MNQDKYTLKSGIKTITKAGQGDLGSLQKWHLLEDLNTNKIKAVRNKC